MTDLFDFIQTQKNSRATVLGNYSVTDLTLVNSHPQTFMFTLEGRGEATGRLATVAVRAVDDFSGSLYEVDVTHTETSKTESYPPRSRAQVESFLRTGQLPDASADQPAG